MRAKKISSSIAQRFQQSLDTAQSLLVEGRHDDSWDALIDALNTIPEPNTEYLETTIVLKKMGNVRFLQKEYDEALGVFQNAVRCPEGVGDIFIHLRLGQCYLELGDHDRAADNLARAYMGGGREAFANENPKYFTIVESVLKPPKGMERLP